MIRSLLIVLAAAAGLWPVAGAAQTPASSNDGVQVGDRWVFDTSDQITGFPKETFTRIVTDLSDKEIVTSFYVRGKAGSAVMVFDRNWDLVDSPIFKFKPNDGQGIQLPLSVGKTWRSEFDQKNTNTGANYRGSVSSKIVAQESVTTSAGTFDTFRVETSLRFFVPADPSKLWEGQIVKWYAPQVNNWVRRTAVLKFDKRTRSSTSEELADFSRKF